MASLLRLTMKYKPKSFEFKDISTLPTDIVKIIGILLKTSVYTCGSCDNLMTFAYGDRRPIRCSRCGHDIDWLGIYRKKIKLCPQCKRTDFELEDIFCDSCAEQVRLKETEVESF